MIVVMTVFKRHIIYFIFAGILFELLFGLGLMVTDKVASVHAVDAAVHTYMVEARTDDLNFTMSWVTHLGDYEFILHTTVIVGLLLAVFGHIELSLGVISSIALTHYFTSVLKHFFHRLRPEDVVWKVGGWSYPSGHASGAAILACMIIWAACAAIPHRVTRIVLTICATMYALMVALSRVYLGVHWFSDVIGGMLLAIAVTAMMMGLLKPVIIKRCSLVK